MAYFNGKSLSAAFQIDHQNRGSDRMDAVSVKYWFSSTEMAYVVASVKTKPDGTQYPWITKFNAEDIIIEYTTCIDTPLIGTYDKSNNLNFALAGFASLHRNSDYYAMIRSQTYSGVLIFDIESDNGQLSNSMVIQDPTHNDTMDGQLLHHSINRFEGIFINSFIFLFNFCHFC